MAEPSFMLLVNGIQFVVWVTRLRMCSNRDTPDAVY